MNTVYLAGPITGCSYEEIYEWREAFTLLWDGNVINPAPSIVFGVMPIPMKDEEIVNRDLRNIEMADVILARCYKASPGTSMEIFHAYRLGRPVVVWTRDVDSLSPWIRHHADRFVLSLRAAITECKKFADPTN